MSNEKIHRSLAGKAEERFLNIFFVMYKTARIIDESNDAFKNQLNLFMDALHGVGAERPTVELKAVGGHYFVNGQVVRFDNRELSGAEGIIAEWEKLGVGGLAFEMEVPPEDVGRLFKLLSAIKPTDHNLETAAAELKKAGLSQIQLLSNEADEEAEPEVSEEERQKFRKMARATFFKAMSTVEEVIVTARSGQEINVAKTKRVVHGLIDHITRDEHSLLELTAIRDFDDYTYAHSTNVTIYALTMGVRLGLDRSRLSQLGFAALFHDVGKVKLPQDLIRKPDAFDENDWLQMLRHPVLGAKTILRNLTFDVHTARAARVALEHHINTDFTGYPRLHYEKREPNFFSRIVSIVDTFDALTSGRVYLKTRMTADVVLKKMAYQMKTKFDVFLLKMFNNIIGIYPAGSLVLLSTDEIALVLTNNEAEPLRPCVKIVGNRQGLLDEPVWADLALAEYHDRQLVRLIEPERYGLNVRDFILTD